jgi:hypothetical protein
MSSTVNGLKKHTHIQVVLRNIVSFIKIISENKKKQLAKARVTITIKSDKKQKIGGN